jgi:two-component system sensor kinase FixL
VALSWWARLSGQVRTPVLATGLGLAVVLSRLLMSGSLGAQAPFILAWPATMMAAFLGGFWPAALVGGGGLIVGQSILGSHGGAPLGPVGAAIYLAFVLVFAAAGGMRKRALRRERDQAQRLSEMHARLAQVARLNAVGEMAGALAHELNQPLTAIASYAGAAQHLARAAGDAGEVTDLLAKVIQQSVRAREIVGRVRGYVKGEELRLEPQSLRTLVEESVAVATAGEPGAWGSVRYEFESGAEAVLADRVQARQVVINLVRNALEAMRGSRRAELRIGARRNAEALIEVFVADNGPGLSQDVAARLFEPFVTGKSDGMGIGLSICRSLVEAHGGRIWAQPSASGGAEFRFTLRPAEASA